jgi:uncharacterized repeat protein (TIGR01451 family)
MKRMLVRLGALVLVVGGGFFAIAQGQRIMGKPTDGEAAGPAATTPEGAPPDLANSASPKDAGKPEKKTAARDPFAGSTLIENTIGATPPLPAAPPKPLTPPPRYPGFENADANPLRGADSAAPAKLPTRDPLVARAGLTEGTEPPAAKKPAPRRDPFDLQPAPGADGMMPKGLPAAEKAPPKDEPPSGEDRYANILKGPPPAQVEGADARNNGPAPLRESPANRDAVAPPVAKAAPRRAPLENQLADATERFRENAPKPAPPQELPRDESLRAITGRRADNGFGGLGRAPAASLGASRRDPSAARPGSRQLDGPQSPQVTLQKIAPSEIQVGSAATFQIVVRNTGNIAAREVVVHDVVPEGTTLVSTAPQAQADGTDLHWSLGTLQPGDEKTLNVKLMPQAEGEIGSVASVTFQADASARTVSTRPELQVELAAPREVMIGEPVTISIKISNIGTGMASGVVLHQKLPPQLKHSAGGELEFDVGDLKPREARQVDLTLTAAEGGKFVDTITARAQGELTAKGSAELEVLAPLLEVALEGPRRRFLEREATYTMSVANLGTAAAKDVELVSHLPKGSKFVAANNAGQYNQQTHAVYWSLAELPQGQSGAVKLVTLPVEAGEQKLIIEGRADHNISHRRVEQIEIEGLAAIMFEVTDLADPIEVGGETTYEVRVVNQGNRAADNVQLTALLPADLKGLNADGPTRGVVDRDRVVFEPLARLAPKADTTYRIRVQGVAPGDQRVRIQLKTDDMSAPVTKEESTHVFADQ